MKAVKIGSAQKRKAVKCPCFLFSQRWKMQDRTVYSKPRDPVCCAWIFEGLHIPMYNLIRTHKVFFFPLVYPSVIVCSSLGLSLSPLYLLARSAVTENLKKKSQSCALIVSLNDVQRPFFSRKGENEGGTRPGLVWKTPALYGVARRRWRFYSAPTKSRVCRR